MASHCQSTRVAATALYELCKFRPTIQKTGQGGVLRLVPVLVKFRMADFERAIEVLGQLVESLVRWSVSVARDESAQWSLIGVETGYQKQKMNQDFINGAVGAFVAGAAMYGYREKSIQQPLQQVHLSPVPVHFVT